MTDRDLYTKRPDMHSSRRGGESPDPSKTRGVSEAPNFHEATREKLNILFDVATDGEDNQAAHLEEKLASGSRIANKLKGNNPSEDSQDDSGIVEDNRTPEQIQKDLSRGFTPTNTDSRTTDVLNVVQGKPATAQDRYQQNHRRRSNKAGQNRENPSEDSNQLQEKLSGLLNGDPSSSDKTSGENGQKALSKLFGEDESNNKHSSYHGQFSHDAREQLKAEAETRNRQQHKHDDRGSVERLLDKIQAGTGIDLVALDPDPVSRGLVRVAELQERQTKHYVRQASKTAGTLIGVAALIIPMMIAGSNSSTDESKSGKNQTGNVACSTPVVADSDTKVGNITEIQKKNTKIIIGVGKAMRIPEYGWVVAIATAMQESNIRVLANPTYPETMSHPNKEGVGSDHDSVGIFQQRPQSGWGKPVELMDAATTAQKFYSRLLTVNEWESMSVAVAAQSVQRSFNGALYSKHENVARKLVEQNRGSDPIRLEGYKPPRSGDSEDNGLSGDGTDPCGVGSEDIPEIDSKKLPIGADASPQMRKVILAAGKYLGTPYSWGGGTLKGPSMGWGSGEGIKGFDCSSYVRYAYHKVLGKDISRTTISQWDAYNENRVPVEDIKPGDLIYYDTDFDGVSEHVAMAIGNNKQVEEPKPGGKAEVNPLRTKGLMGVLRPIDTYS